MNSCAESMLLDDTMLHVFIDRVLRAQREGRRATKEELLSGLDEETEARRAQHRMKQALCADPDALKHLLRAYCETTNVVELTAHARSVNGQFDIDVTERRAAAA